VLPWRLASGDEASGGARRWGIGSGRKPVLRGTQFGAVGRRRLTKDSYPWRDGSAEGSLQWPAGEEVRSADKFVGEELWCG
jgi:hypothetical protein